MTTYYAKQSCMIDGKAYNAGEIVPESVLKHNGEVTMHLVRKEGESVEAPKPNANGLTTKASREVVDAKEEEDTTELPSPMQTADEKKEDTKDEDTTAKTGEDESVVTPASNSGDAKKDADTKKDSKVVDTPKK